MRTYPEVDFPGVLPPNENQHPPYAKINQENAGWAGHLESNTLNFSILGPGTSSGTIQVTAERHIVGGGNKPTTNKVPIPDLVLAAFDMKDNCLVQSAPPYGFTWQNYGSFWKCPHYNTAVTDSSGKAAFSLPPGGYIIIGEYKPDSNSKIYLGASAGGVTSGGVMNKYLQLIEKADGKNVPAKYTVITGSELMIIEPEYVEWDGTQELYPFIFQSIGDWGVVTSIAPPEGFVPDYKSLSTQVSTSTAALQFTITDVGSKWVDTNVEHQIKHKGKTQKLSRKIGVKLSESLARQKGLGVLGHEDRKK
jgi:hypothetical protein